MFELIKVGSLLQIVDRRKLSFAEARTQLVAVCLKHRDCSIHLERACSMEPLDKIKQVFIYST